MKRFQPTIEETHNITSLRHHSSDTLTIQTDQTGRIPIRSSWASMFETLKDLNGYYFQSKHSYARLVARTEALDFRWKENVALASDRDRLIEIRPNQQHRIAALVARCHCCHSPGRIEVRNEYNLEVMQICCDHDTPAIDFGNIVARCASEAPATQAQVEPSKVSMIPKDAKCIASGSRLFMTLLEILSRHGIEFITTLKTTGVIHSERMAVKAIEYDNELLTVMDENKTLQIGLPGIRNVFAKNIHEEPELYLSGPNNVQLLALNAFQSTKSNFRNAILEALKQLNIKIN